jgi:DNA polymerase III subunit beta
MLSANVKELKEVFEMAAKLTAPRASLASLATVKVVTSKEDQTTVLMATDLSSGIVIRSNDFEVTSDHSTCIPAALFTSILRGWRDDTIKLDMNERTQILKVTSPGGKGKANVKCILGDEFPPMPDLEKDPEKFIFTVASEEFRSAVERVALAASDDEARPILAGVNFSGNGSQKLTLFAADGFRLATDLIPYRPTNEVKPFNSVVPTQAVRLASQILDGDEIKVGIVPGNRAYLISSDSRIQIVSQLIEGTPPEYTQVIPKGQQDNRFTFSATEAEKVLRLASLMASGSNLVRLKVNYADKALEFSTRDDETGDFSEAIEIKTDLEEGEFLVGFNIKLLSEFLRNLNGEVHYETKTPESPLRMNCPALTDWTGVLMPMHISQ